MSATRRDLARLLSERLKVKMELSQRESLAIVNEFFDVMIDVIQAEKRVEIRGFGVFEVGHIKAHRTVDPRTGEPMRIPRTTTVDFKPGKELKAAISARKGKKKS